LGSCWFANSFLRALSLDILRLFILLRSLMTSCSCSILLFSYWHSFLSLF
jgi:hypothetical protein